MSYAAAHTENPIRRIVDHLNIPPNPALEMIPLSIGSTSCSRFQLWLAWPVTVKSLYLSRGVYLIMFPTGDPTTFGNMQPDPSVIDAVVAAAQGLKVLIL